MFLAGFKHDLLHVAIARSPLTDPKGAAVWSYCVKAILVHYTYLKHEAVTYKTLVGCRFDSTLQIFRALHAANAILTRHFVDQSFFLLVAEGNSPSLSSFKCFFENVDFSFTMLCAHKNIHCRARKVASLHVQGMG